MTDNNDKLTYGASEEYIKTYYYHTSSSKEKEVKEVERSLIVTNRRIILEEKNKSGFSRDDFPIDFIERTDTRFYHSKKNKTGIVLLVFGLLISTGGFLTKNSLSNVFSGFNIALASFGIVLFVCGLLYMILKKTKQAFRITFSSSRKFYDFSNISGENYVIRQRKIKKSSKKAKVISKVTPAALVMINELNGLLIDIRDFNFQADYAKQMYLRNKLSIAEYEKHYAYLLERILNKYK